MHVHLGHAGWRPLPQGTFLVTHQPRATGGAGAVQDICSLHPGGGRTRVMKPMDAMDHYEAGLEVRREVLGPEYVDQGLRRASDFSRPMQEFVTEYCWGAVWARPGLDRRIRSLLNLAMLTAL